ncbi:unnamed protein product [Ilex paraguariensis]|uniref:Transcription factor GTE7-like n=1 Tax=Ilex paraguariensis TaxID=185542 RepID=A0ABC8QWT2_9AQUA
MNIFSSEPNQTKPNRARPPSDNQLPYNPRPKNCPTLSRADLIVFKKGCLYLSFFTQTPEPTTLRLLILWQINFLRRSSEFLLDSGELRLQFHVFSFIRSIFPEICRSSTTPLQFMAAVLASGNESSWGQSSAVGLMAKLPYSNPHLKNPKPNPNPKNKHKFNTANGQHADDSTVVTQTTSDDAYSFNQRSVEGTSRNGFNHGGYISFNLASCSNSELSELKQRLVAELERIRNLNNQIDSGQLQPRSHGKIKKLSGSKRPFPCGSKKDLKGLCQTSEFENGHMSGNGKEGLMKMCRQVLTKLMKHKFGWVFNKPVDAVALGLHDYHRIIKQPMDLGTVKGNLAKGLFVSPVDFAADVRLTFNNALLYNPKTDEVNGMAEQLLGIFEDMFRPIQEKIGGDRKEEDRGFVGDELQGSSWSQIPTPERVKKSETSPKPPISNKKDQMQSGSSASNPSNSPLNPAPVQSPVPSPSSMPAPPGKPVAVRGSSTKQPKPKAKDPNKREMSMEEKQKLGIGLQSLPQEKMPQLVQIIGKRNEHLAQEGDEIELDIEALDTETLWELDRFVTNWKKMASKTKRQALMSNNSAGAGTITTTSAEADRGPMRERTDLTKKPKKGEAGDEDVDIDDDMPATNFPSVEIEKDEGGYDQNHGHANSSSSGSSGSSSDSSSSSDSGSGSSSGSDSDADDAQS